jgi:hypothetical protein
LILNNRERERERERERSTIHTCKADEMSVHII